MAFFSKNFSLMRYAFVLILATVWLNPIYADEFKIKLDVDLVDHTPAAGVLVQVVEKGKEMMSVTLEADGETKFELEKGKLFEIWIRKSGYLPHVIHSVHAEGKSKHSLLLYKETKKVSYKAEEYTGVNRTFLDVKKMTIPAEYLADGVNTVTEESLTKVETVNLKTVGKLAKSQEKAQKKIDSTVKKKRNLKRQSQR